MKNRLFLLLLTALLVFAAVLAGIKEVSNDQPIYAVVSSGSQKEELNVWYDQHYGIVYIFLPAYADLDKVSLYTAKDGAYRIGEHLIYDGFSCSTFALNTSYPMSVQGDLPYDGKQLIFVRSGNISTLFVDVQSGSMDYLLADKKHSEAGDLRLYDQDGALLYAGQADAVSGRGQSSWWGQVKKPFNITLREEADLLGLGSAKSWCLLACAGDHSFLRNKLVFDFAELAGIPYSPDCTWIDLYLNGEYAGLYLLCEPIEVHPERVAIGEENSFLVTKDFPDRLGTYQEDYFTTADNASIGILSSDFPIYTLAGLWQSVENAVLSEDGIDPTTGKSWDELIDPRSWAKKFLLEESFGNIDAPVLSQYYYLDGSQENPRICASPPWDYEVAMTRPVNMVHMYRRHAYGSYWHWGLYQKPDFYNLLVQEYRDVFRPLLLEFAETRIPAYLNQIRAAASMNKIRWKTFALEDAAAEVEAYINGRTAFLDSVWLEQKEYITVNIIGHGRTSVYTYLLKPGSSLPELRSYDHNTGIIPLGWFYENTDISVDPAKPLYEDTTVEFRWEDIPEAEENVSFSWEPGPEPIPKTRLLALFAFLVMLALLLFEEIVRCWYMKHH